MSRALATVRNRGRKAVMEQLLETLCNEYRPQLHSLVYNPRMPDPQLTTLLEWADDLAAADPSSGLDLEVLEEVLPALNTAFLASFAFAPVPVRHRAPRAFSVGLELTDRGGGLLVQCTRTCASLLAVGLHGDAGVALVARADEELREALEAISQAIVRPH